MEIKKSLNYNSSYSEMIISRYYISTNEAVATLEEFNLDTMKHLITNMVIMIGFAVLFILLANVVTRKKRKIG